MRTVERAVILAAGLGTRLKWLTRNKPKALMQVAGEAAVAHVIRSLAAQGVRDIVLNLHHHCDALARYLGDGSRWGVRLYFSKEIQLLDSGGGVKKALQYLPGQGLFVIHNADIISNINVHDLARAAEKGCAITLVKNPPHHPQGDFAVRGSYADIAGEPRYTFAGVSVWDEVCFSQFTADYSEDTAFSLVEPMRQSMAIQGCSAILHKGYWYDIGRPRDLMAANAAMARAK